MMRRFQLVLPLFVFWVMLCGRFDPVEMGIGAGLSLVIGVWFGALVWAGEPVPELSIRSVGRFLLYVPYLIVEIARASVHVAEKVLDPSMPIDPVMVDFQSMLERPVSRVALANSITLTPGTLTVDVDEATFVVHCLGGEFRQGITERTLEQKVAHVFEEA